MATALNTIITFFVSSFLGYSVKTIKEYKKKNKGQEIALRALLKSQLTNTYFVYSEVKQIPDYVYQNFLDMLEVYESLQGNGFVHTLAKKMESWEVVKTDIL